MTTPSGEWQDIPKNGQDFHNNETGKSRSKNARYLATIEKGNTAEWDCSCLLFAILFSDNVGTTLGATIRKEVDDLRQVRNDIAHINEVELTDAEFQNYVARVIAAFTSLKLSTDEIQDVKNQSSFTTAEVNRLKIQIETLTQEISSKVESFCSLTFKPTHQIIRRSNDVTRIKNNLEELYNESKGAISTIYLSGIPGCGKSQFARQVGKEVYDKSLREDEGLTFVSTLNAETLDSLADSYFNLAKQLGVTEYALTNLATSTKVDSSEKIQHLMRFISPKVKQFSAWLIIVDNVVDLSVVRSYLPPTASEEWGHGQMLVTTQDTQSIPFNSPHTYHESLSEGMHPDDAVDLLREVSQISNQQQAEEVAKVLEYQPLALAAAAVYVQTMVSYGTPNYGWTKYLETFNSEEREAREEVLAEINGAYPKTMTTAIRIAITRALESDEVLRAVFSLFSLCASDSLPIEAAVGFVKSRIKHQTEALIRAKILKSTMITCLYDKQDRPTYLRVHNVVHNLLKSVVGSVMDLTDKAKCFSVAVTIFQSLIEDNKAQLLASDKACIKLRMTISHCKGLLQFFSTNFTNTELRVDKLFTSLAPGELVSWLSWTSEVCCNLSNLSGAQLFCESCSDFVNDLSDEPNDKLVKANYFRVQDIVYSHLGKYYQAKEYHEKSLSITKEIYGEQHGDIATSYNNLGTVFWELHQYDQAKEYFEKSFRIRKDIYDENHSDENHSDLAASYNNLGLVYRDLSQYNQAKEYHEQSLAIRKEIYGEHHGDVATSQNNLGTVCSALGEHEEAKKYYEKSLASRKAIYGEHHGDVAASYNNLGVVYRHLGEYNQAKEYNEKSLAIRKEIYGEHHGDVAASYNNLGLVYKELGPRDRAEEYYKKSLDITKKIYGEHHGDVAESYNNLGLLYRDLLEHEEAEKYSKMSLEIREKIYGKSHEHVAVSYNNLGLVYSDLKKYKKAKKCHKKSLAIKRKIFDEHHGDVAASYNNLGTAYSDLAKHNKAKKCYKESLDIRKEIYGEDHGNLQQSYSNLGAVCLDLKQYDEAEEYYEKSLAINKKIHGEEHASVATSYFGLGLTYSSLKRYGSSQNCFEQALKLYKEVHDESHDAVKGTYHNLQQVVARQQRKGGNSAWIKCGFT